MFEFGVQKARIIDQEALGRITTEAEKWHSSAAVLEVELAEVRRQFDELESIHAAALKKEKDTVERLSTTIQKHRMSEDALGAEIKR